MKYRELGVKVKLDAGMTDEEAFELLATDGMLVKRPLVVTDTAILVGFKEAAWEETLLLRQRIAEHVTRSGSWARARFAFDEVTRWRVGNAARAGDARAWRISA